MYMFFWFFKQLYYCLRRIFKSGILLLIVFFIAFLFIFVKPTLAFEQNDLHFSGFSSSKQTDIYNFIQSNKGNYDSVFVRYYWSNPADYGYPEKRLSFSFYNYSDLGKLYKTLLGTGQGFNYIINSQYSKTNSVHYIGVDYDDFSNILTDNYQNTINIGIRDFTTGVNNNINNTSFFATNRDIYSNNNYNDVWFIGSNTSLNGPYIINSSSNIINFSFNNLDINAGSLSFNDYYEIRFTYPDDNTIYTGNINSYKYINNGVLYFSIPKSFFTQDIVIRSNSRITFALLKYHRQEPSVSVETYSLGSYILSLTNQEQQEINEDSNKQILSDISNNQKETTQSIENLEDTITNPNIDNSSINLPTDSSNDITQDGLNGIFTSIYNAFCAGSPKDIVFPFPFTNKNITLPANYVREMLSNNGGSWVITLIEAFWWYLISRFIIKDITNKITKIKSGNIEDIENSNIKGDML